MKKLLKTSFKFKNNFIKESWNIPNYVEKGLIVFSLLCNMVVRKSANIHFISVLKKVNIIENWNYLWTNMYFIFFTELMKLPKCIAIWSWEVHWFKTNNWDCYHKNKYMIKSMEFGIYQVTRYSKESEYIDCRKVKMFQFSSSSCTLIVL